jgi:L-gulonolactone oxidase
MVNSISLSLFNALYFHWPRARQAWVDYQPYFYPLDRIGHWNRLYGPSGFYQYQFVIPFEAGLDPMQGILESISAKRQGSFLAVLKCFDARASAGLMSFPSPGYCLALDFPNREGLMPLLQTLDEIILRAGGRLYPAKDARMSARLFQKGFPQWVEFSRWIDPAFESALWRRVSQVGEGRA